MTAENYSPCVYVSYAYQTEEETKLLEKLKEQLRDKCGFDLRVDKDRVKAGASFSAFMQEIGRAKHVIVLISEAYYQSFYCMTELLNIVQSKQLDARVIPIWIGAYEANKQPIQEKIKAFWDDAYTQLSNGEVCAIEAATLSGIQKIIEHLDDCLLKIGSLHALRHPENKMLYKEVEKCVLFPDNEKNGVKGLKRGADTQFKKELEDKVKALLDQSDVFCLALKEELERNPESNADLAKALCQEADEDSYELIEYTLFDAVQEAHKQLSHKADKEALLKMATQLVSCLVLLSVEDKWIESWSADTKISSMRMNLEVDTVSAALVITSRLHQRIPAFAWQEGTTKLYGKDELTIPKKQSGWSVDTNVKEVLKQIWDQVNPQETGKDLDEKHYADLNRQLERLYRRGFKQHYISNEGNEYAYIRDRNVLFGIQHYLPSLVILVLEDKSGNTKIALHNDRELMETLRDFLKQLHLLG